MRGRHSCQWASVHALEGGGAEWWTRKRRNDSHGERKSANKTIDSKQHRRRRDPPLLSVPLSSEHCACDAVIIFIYVAKIEVFFVFVLQFYFFVSHVGRVGVDCGITP